MNPPTDAELQRLSPQDMNAEQGLLSSLLLSPEWAGGICDEKGITPAHFHAAPHRTAYAVAREQIDAGLPCDFIALTSILRNRGQLESIGGAAFVTGLYTFIPTAANAAYYADILADKHTLRRMIEVCGEFVNLCHSEQEQPAAMLDGLEAAVLAIRKGDEIELREVHAKAGAMQAINDIEALYDRRGEISGLPSGFSEFDKMTDGFHEGEMIVIAARPSMGKTALAMNMAEHAALVSKKAVVVFSCEMSAKQLYTRLACSVARVNMHRVRDGFLAERDFPALTHAACKIGESKLIVIDAVGATIGAVRAKARRLHRRHGLAAIFVDYLQLLRSKSAQASKNREREISEISQGLKNLAKELNIPVIVLAQLNRNPEGRTGSAKGRPMLSDLRESGSIEQDADLVGLLVREEYYATNDEEKREMEGKATLIIAKQRNGPVGDVPLTFLKEFTRFEDRAKEAAEEPRDYTV